MAQARRETKGTSKQRGKRSSRIPHSKPNPPKDRSIDGNQGEGNREAERRYREGATEFERSGRVPKAADEARSVEQEERQAGREPRDELDDDIDGYDEDLEDDLEEPIRESRDRSRLS